MDSLRAQDHPHQRRSRRDNPSFSSTLLDAIYRSIDESNGNKAGGGVDRELIYYKETMRKKQHGNGLTTRGRSDEEMDIDSSTRSRACIIERWMEKKVSFEKKDVVRRKSMPADNSSSLSPAAVLLNSSSSSSESSCGGGFSSSESDSMYGSRSRSSSCYSMQKPKPIRTSISSSSAERNYNVSTQKKQQPKSDHQGGFVKTKSKALKIYSDLKKVKQPISPGGRLASFLNSLFTAGNAKKAKILKPEQPESACSSASSFSRSCLSKTPSSRGKLSNNGAKRSVRFYPVSVIVDEDSRPCGHKNLYENEQTVASNIVIRSSPSSTHHINEELQYHVMSESQRVEEAARELLKNYQKKKEFKQMRGICTNDIWNAPELFDLSVLEGETIREWLFFDKPRRAFESGNRKQRSLPDYSGRGWHESRKQVMNEFGGLKRSYYMDPQPLNHFEWHLYEYEINKCDACALYRLELKLVDGKKSAKGKLANDSVADLQKQMGRLTAEFPSDNKRLVKGRAKVNAKAGVGGNIYPASNVVASTNEKFDYGPTGQFDYLIENLSEYYLT